MSFFQNASGTNASHSNFGTIGRDQNINIQNMTLISRGDAGAKEYYITLMASITLTGLQQSVKGTQLPRKPGKLILPFRLGSEPNTLLSIQNAVYHCICGNFPRSVQRRRQA